MDSDMMRERLHAVRCNYGKSIEEYCAKLDVEIEQYIGYERTGDNVPSELLVKISKITGCNIDYLISEFCTDARVGANKYQCESSQAMAIRLTSMRVQQNARQEDIAQVLGIARSTYSGYERAASSPPWDVIVKLSKYYGVSVNYLLGIGVEEAVNNRCRIKKKTQK